MVLHAKHNILTTTLIILTHVSALGTNSNIKWPVFQRAEAWRGRTIRCTTEAHDNTTVHGDRIISPHAENNLRQTEFKAKFINGDFTRRACVKFVYHVIFHDDPYKLGMTWSFDLCYGDKLVSRLQLSLKRGFRGITAIVFVVWKYLTKNIFTLEILYKKCSLLPSVCSVIDYRWRHNVVRTKKWHLRRSWVCHWCSHHILTCSVIFYCAKPWQPNLFVDVICLSVLE